MNILNVKFLQYLFLVIPYNMYTKDLFLFVLSKIKTFLDVKEAESITKLILQHYYNIDNLDILKNIDLNINFDDIKENIDNVVDRLKKNEPIQYILESVKFLNCDLNIRRNVFIPRPETEEIVYNILKYDLNNKNILDICSGSGCISVSIAKNTLNSNVYGIDINNEAIELYRENAKKNNVNVNYIQKDIFSINNDDFKDIKFDVIISNPPYVCKNEIYEMKNNVIDYEPLNAIFVDNDDPLIFYKQIKLIVNMHLNTNGMIFLEINERFGDDILKLFSDLNFKRLSINKDINGKDRWLSGLYYE